MTVLAERAVINKDAEFEELHPRDPDGRFSRIGAALHALSEAFGEIISHAEFGEPDHDANSHGVMTLHADGRIVVSSVDGEGGHGVIVQGGPAAAWGELLDSISTSAEDAPAADEVLTYDYSEEFGHQLDVSFGKYSGGDAFVGLDSEEHGFSLEPEYAEGFVSSFGELTDARDAHLGGDPTFTHPLPATASLVRRKTFNDEYADNQVIAGLVSDSAGLHVRLGVISAGSDEARKWTGGRGKTTLDLDRDSAAQVAELLETYDSRGKARQKINDKILNEALAAEDAGEEVDWEDVDAQIRAALKEIGDSPLPGQEQLATWESDFDYDTIETAWGSIRLTDVGTDDEGNGHKRNVRVEIWPAGMTEAEYDAGQKPDGGPDWAWPGAAERYEKPTAGLTAKDIQALIKLLRGTFDGAEPIAKSARSTAGGVDRNRIAREGRKYWTRSAEGLAKWARSAHPWTALHRHLATKMDPETADRLTSSYFRAVFGYAPSARQGKNPVGKG